MPREPCSLSGYIAEVDVQGRSGATTSRCEGVRIQFPVKISLSVYRTEISCCPFSYVFTVCKSDEVI